jgi:FkbM family methyltransferase
MHNIKKILNGLFHLLGFEVNLLSKINAVNLLRHKWLVDQKFDIIFDVGANQGQFATKIRKYFPTTSLFSFEPIDTCFAILNKNFATDKNFSAYNFAIGDTDSETTFNLNESTASSSLLKMNPAHYENYPGTKNYREQKVSIRKLDTLFPNMADGTKILLKIDVQGFEYSVLRGAENLLNYVRVIIVEVMFENLYAGQSTFDQINAYLNTQGFFYHGNYDQEFSPLDGKPIFADLIYLRK